MVMKRLFPLWVILARMAWVEAQSDAQIQYFSRFVIGGEATTLFIVHNTSSGEITVTVDLFVSHQPSSTSVFFTPTERAYLRTMSKPTCGSTSRLQDAWVKPEKQLSEAETG